MTKINVSLDTDSGNKGFSVSLNGQTISNVREFSCYQEADKNGDVVSVGASIYTFEEADNNTVKSVSYHSYGSAKAQKLEESGQVLLKDIDGFVGIESFNAVGNDIMEFLKKSRRRGVYYNEDK